jgi:dihydrolipoamide dehydrogenase/pyruvate dehydrogenase complex dihydrolipoamide acetyltransferase long form
MPIEIVMPKLGLTMTEGLIVEWKKKEGDHVRQGEVLFILETEKVTYEVEAAEDGILGKIFVQEKETVPVGTVVAYLYRAGETVSETEEIKELPGEAIPKPSERVISDVGILSPETADLGGRVKASPRARKVARSYGIDLRSVTGTGPKRRIIEEDIEKAYEDMQKAVAGSEKAAEAPGEKPVPLTGMRRAIASKMLMAKLETAQTYVSLTVDASQVVAFRQAHLVDIQENAGVRLTITDIMMKITGAALRRHPVINTRWTDEGIVYLQDVHMGMAMALNQGLIVPVIRDINKKSLSEIARVRTELIEKGRNNRILPDDITGSTFTISTLGMYNIEHFTAIINVPESAILAVGAIIDKPVVVDGEIVVRPMMNISLSYDHRIIDGAEAAKFMQTLQSLIENPVAILQEREAIRVTGRTRLVVIGGGTAGYPAAIVGARLGAKVTLVEKDKIGGVCLNRGCIPTKSLLHSSHLVNSIRNSGLFGIKCGEAGVDFPEVMRRKNTVVDMLRNGVEKLIAAKEIRVVHGTAELLDSSTVRIRETKEDLHADRIIIASGARPRKLLVESAAASDLLDSDDFLSMEELPASVAIIGGGYVGVEFAQILAGFGAEVTLLEAMEYLIPGADREIAQAFQKCISDSGIAVFTKARIDKIVPGERKQRLTFTHEGTTHEIETQKILCCVGREPDLAWLDLDKLGLATRRGALFVNEQMETSVAGIYAAGDVVGGFMLAHVAMAEGECAARNAMGEMRAMDYGSVPLCIYTNPEVASVGLTEEEAREKTDVRVGRFSFHGSGKAMVMNETVGMVKIISDGRSGRVLGVHILGPHATDLIAEAVLGLSMKITVEQLSRAIHPHPTLSETIMESASTLCGGAIHMP